MPSVEGDKAGCQCGGQCSCKHACASRVALRVLASVGGHTIYPADAENPYFYVRNHALLRRIKQAAIEAGFKVSSVKQGSGSQANFVLVYLDRDRSLDDMKALANFLVEAFPSVAFSGDVHPIIDIDGVTIPPGMKRGPNMAVGQRPN